MYTLYDLRSVSVLECGLTHNQMPLMNIQMAVEKAPRQTVIRGLSHEFSELVSRVWS